MPRLNPSADPSLRRNNAPYRALVSVIGALGAAAFFGQSPANAAQQAPAGIHIELPGGADRIGRPTNHVSAEVIGRFQEPATFRRLKRSAVAIVIKNYHSDGFENIQVCNGTMEAIRDPDTDLTVPDVVKTATHCLRLKEGALQGKTGSIRLDDQMKDQLYIANPRDFMLTPLAKVVGAITSNDPSGLNNDVALLRLQPIPQQRRRYRTIKPFPIDTVKNETRKPNRGEIVYMYGAQALNPNPFSATGVYAGREFMTGATGSGGIVDIVRTVPKSPMYDPCYFIKSGSSAITKKNYLFHPLLTRIGPNDGWYLQQTRRAFGNNPKQIKKRIALFNKESARTIREFDKRFGFNPNPNAVYCMFGTPSQTSNYLVGMLNKPFKEEVPITTPPSEPAPVFSGLNIPQLQPMGVKPQSIPELDTASQQAG